MRNFTYWKAVMIGDADCYSIRAKTRKECRALVAAEQANWDDDAPDIFCEPEKIVVPYFNMMDLVRELRGEDACSY